MVSDSESLLLDSRLNRTQINNENSIWQKPTSVQKWWAAILLGCLFAILSSGLAFNITEGLTSRLGFSTLSTGNGPTIWGLLIHTLIFIVVVRFILW